MANLYGAIKQSTQVKQLGEKFGICAEFVNKTGPAANQIYLSSTFDCWDSQGNHIVTAFPVTLTQTFANGGMQIRYVMATGPNKTITSAGTYSYIFSVKTSDGDVTQFEQTALINSLP